MALLLLTALSTDAEAAPASVSLGNSIREVEDAPLTGPLNPHKAFITRRALTSVETGALMEFEVALKMRNLPELQTRVAHGEHLSPQEMAAKYDPLPADYDQVRAWLTAQGFEITREDDTHLAIFARGKISQIQGAMQSSFARVSYEGTEYTSAITAPNLPATLSPLLVGVNGLQPHIQWHKHLVARPNSLSNSFPPFLPSQTAQAYNASSLYASNVTGTNQGIAIVIDTFPAVNDLTSFWQTYSVNQTINDISFIQVVTGTLPAPSGEETLDTEWSSSIAPSAKVRVYATVNLLLTSVDKAYQQVYTDTTAHPEYGLHQMSISYGIAETLEPISQLQTDAQYFANLASAGVTIFASSGDQGGTPDSSSGYQVSAESPATDLNVTGVGGTSLSVDSNGNPTSEVTWNNSTGATGGAPSINTARPSWQTGTGVQAGNTRLVPDVACTADPYTGAVVILNGSQVVYGGTSWSTPTWAGFCALLNQYRANAGLAPIGTLNPSIYPLLGTANFRDIVSGNNSFDGMVGYSASAGYDLDTGLGVPNVLALAQTLSNYQPIVFTNSALSTTIPVGSAFTFNFTTSNSPAPTFSVGSGSLPPGLALSATGVLTGTPTGTGGLYTGTVLATYGPADSSSQSFQIAVDAAPAFTSTPINITVAVGQSFTAATSVSGYPTSFTYTLASGSLPNGVSLQSSGAISGSAQATGTFTGTIQVSNGISPSATQSFTISVTAAAPAFTDGPPPTTATAGTAYSFVYTFTGNPTPRISLLSGHLPTGLTLSTGGTLSGTPTTPGTFTGVGQASSSVNPKATQSFTITVPSVSNSAPAFNDPPINAIETFDSRFSLAYTNVSGFPVPTFSRTAGTLPTGVTFSSAGVFSGTPTQSGVFTGTVDAGNGVSPDATQSYTITVAQAPQFTSSPSGTLSLNTPISAGTAFVASGYPAPAISVSASNLPAGVNLSSSGVLSGTPTQVGIYSATIMASNSAGLVTETFYFYVYQVPTFTSGPPPSTATFGTGYSFNYTAQSYPVPSFTVASGSLPPGLSLSYGGSLSGTPTQGGVYSGTVQVSNGLTANATQNFTITVNQPPTVTNGPPTATATTSVLYSFAYQVSGYPTVVFNVNSSSLPPGLSLSSAGVLSGTPTMAGVFTGTITATNGISPSFSQNFTITVTNPPEADSPTMPPWALAILAGILLALAGRSIPQPRKITIRR